LVSYLFALHKAIQLLIANSVVAGEIIGTCLGMVGVLALTRANKVDQQVGPNNLIKSPSMRQISASNPG